MVSTRFKIQPRSFAPGVMAVFALTTVGCRSSVGQEVPVSVPVVDPISGMVGVGTWKTQAEFKDIKVTKGNQTLFASDPAKTLSGLKALRGQWRVVEGALRQSGNDEDTRALAGDAQWSDYTLSLKARKLSGSEGFLILFGVPDEKTRGWWNLGGWNNTQHAIEGPGIASERVSGVIETGRWYDIRIELIGNTIRGYLDNQLVQTATQIPETHTVPFSTVAQGKKLPLTHWGIDTAWAQPDHMKRGILYMGKDNIDVVRVSFPINVPLENGDLPASKHEHFTTRIAIAKMAGDKPWTMLPDTEAGVHPWFKNGRDVIPERWVQLIAASQRRYGKKLEAIEAFNEADYGWGQGSAQNLNDILGALQSSPDFKGVEFGGPSTLNADAAKSWYDATKSRLQRATTHSLGGTMESYINFFKTAGADGKMLENPEAHNVAEVISGAEYGMKQAIWWGTAERTRGEFVKAVQGERLAYAEDRPRWTCAGVYRAPSGKLQAFVGSSERMGQPTKYRFVATDRPVYFNGDGPRREFTVPIRQHGEMMVDITWGEDVASKTEGRYVIVNRHSGKVLGVAGANKENGAGIQQMDYSRATHQQWDVAPFVGPYGDQSYFTMRAVHSGKSLDTAEWNYDEGGKIQQWGEGDAGAQHWYFEYAGNNNYYIRSRWSTKCLGAAGGSKAAGATVQQFTRKDDPRLQWRLVPVSALEQTSFDTVAPAKPNGVTATATEKAVEVKWQANKERDQVSYLVFRSTSAAGPYDTIARGVTGPAFVDTDVAAGSKYFYKVKAVDLSLNLSGFSEVAGVNR